MIWPMLVAAIEISKAIRSVRKSNLQPGIAVEKQSAARTLGQCVPNGTGIRLTDYGR
jgi:hypothetical protein